MIGKNIFLVFVCTSLHPLSFLDAQKETLREINKRNKKVVVESNSPNKNSKLMTSYKCKNGDYIEGKGCVCWPEYGKISDTNCQACDCGRGSNCTFERRFFELSYTKTCVCREGYKIKYSKCVGPCTKNKCENGGTCVDDNPGKYKCLCQVGFTGENCEYREISTRSERFFTTGETAEPPEISTRSESFFTTAETAETPEISTRSEGFFTTGETAETPEISTRSEGFFTTGETAEPPEISTRSESLFTTAETAEPPAKTGCEDYGGNFECHMKGNFWTCINDNYVESNYTCACLPGYKINKGRCIEESCDCGRNSYSCQKNDEGENICNCFHGYAQLKGVCTDCHCGENFASCYFNGIGRKVCICRDGFTEKNGTCTKMCQSHSDCLNGGFCYFEGYGSFCNCVLPYTGDRCEINSICENMKSSCSSFGAVCQYIPSTKQGTCICPQNKIFNQDLKLCEDKFEFTQNLFFILMCITAVLLLFSMIAIVCLYRKFGKKSENLCV